MKTDIIKGTSESAGGTLSPGDDWFDSLEAGARTRIRGFIEELLEAELDAALGRDRYERPRLESGPYDKLAGTFFSALCLVVIVAYWRRPLAA